MNDIVNDVKASGVTRLTNEDESLVAGIESINGKNRVLTDTNISSVNIPLGKDPLPDTYFTIITAGAIGDTVRIDIAATNNDNTSPDDDLPAYTKTYTLIASDVGNEHLLADHIAEMLTNDILFEDQFLTAISIGEKYDNNRAIVHVTSTKFSLNGEFYERPNIGDFDVITTGTTVVQFYASDFRALLSRPKEVSLARDPRNPHRLGVQSISGSVFIRSTDPEALIRTRIEEVGNSNMNMSVDGSITPVIFEYNANPNNGPDLVIDSLKFFGSDTNIKVNSAYFLGKSGVVANGIKIELIRDGIAILTDTLYNTIDLLAVWSTSASDNKIIGQSGGDYFESTFSLADKNLALVLRNGEADLIRVTIQDDLSSIDTMYLLIGGVEG